MAPELACRTGTNYFANLKQMLLSGDLGDPSPRPLRRRSLVDRLATDTSGVLELAHVAMLADTHTAIQAVEAELLELEGEME